MNPDFIFFDFSLPDSMSCFGWTLDDNFPFNINHLNILSLNLID